MKIEFTGAFGLRFFVWGVGGVSGDGSLGESVGTVLFDSFCFAKRVKENRPH